MMSPIQVSIFHNSSVSADSPIGMLARTLTSAARHGRGFTQKETARLKDMLQRIQQNYS
jgi:hypothetical protein